MTVCPHSSTLVRERHITKMIGQMEVVFLMFILLPGDCTPPWTMSVSAKLQSIFYFKSTPKHMRKFVGK